jgi:hypothetical protein
MTADPTPAADPRLAEPFVDEHGFDHADDSYGQCFRCRIWSEGSGDDEVYLSEPWPCPTVRLALLPARTATTEAEALEACTGTDEDCPHHDCPDGWHYGSDLPCSCSPDCATAIAAGPAARPGGGR